MAIECKNLTNGLRISTNGKYFACCHTFNAPFVDKNGVSLVANKDTIEDALNSFSRQQMISAFEKDVRHPACKVCWDAEDAGFQSKRQRDNDTFKTIPNKNVEDIYFLELNLGNTCNLACRICHVSASSKWRNYHRVNEPSMTDEELDAYARDFSKAFTDDSSVWEELLQLLPKVKQIDIYGGEPMLMKKQWELLKYCVDNGYAKDQHMSFNTNGTIISDEYVKILSSFRYCRIGFSIDGVGDRFQYLRYPGNWPIVDSNIKSWLEKTKHLGPDKMMFELACTVSVLNVLYIFEIVDYVIANNLKLFMSFVYNPVHLSITNMPENIKAKVLGYLEPILKERLEEVGKIENNSYLIEYYRQAKKVIDTIKLPNPSSSKEWNELKRQTIVLDEMRKENYALSFPEAEEIFEIYKSERPVLNINKTKPLI
jgi:MoaA/NifB/PqqE/SkfB family radical SAM enzyme